MSNLQRAVARLDRVGWNAQVVHSTTGLTGPCGDAIRARGAAREAVGIHVIARDLPQVISGDASRAWGWLRDRLSQYGQLIGDVFQTVRLPERARLPCIPAATLDTDLLFSNSPDSRPQIPQRMTACASLSILALCYPSEVLTLAKRSGVARHGTLSGSSLPGSFYRPLVGSVFLSLPLSFV